MINIQYLFIRIYRYSKIFYNRKILIINFIRYYIK